MQLLEKLEKQRSKGRIGRSKKATTEIPNPWNWWISWSLQGQMGSQVGPASGEELREEPVPLSLVVGLVALWVCRAGRGEEAPVTEQGERGQDLLAAPPPFMALAAERGPGCHVGSPSKLPQTPLRVNPTCNCMRRGFWQTQTSVALLTEYRTGRVRVFSCPKARYSS